jgi:predicted enzyme related to lactoylglutathione lyase
MPQGPYVLFKSGGKTVAGMLGVDEQAGIPPHWMPFVSVANLDAAVARAGRLGAKVLVPQVSIEHVGRWAVLLDPQGGSIAPFEPAPGAGDCADAAPPVGAFCWDELGAADPDASLRFYTELFNWRAQREDMGSAGAYTLLHAGATQVGGLLKMQGPPHTCWLSYAHVADVDGSARQAATLGAKILAGPFDLPGVGRCAVLLDPTGAAVALYRSARS